MSRSATVYANATTPPTCSAGRGGAREFVLGALPEQDLSTPAEYVEAIDSLPLGPMCQLGCLVIRIFRTSVLGLDRATTRDVEPTDAELDKMPRCWTTL